MTFPSLLILESKKELRTFLYHIKEIILAQASVASLIKDVNDKLERDPDGAAECLSSLEVEVFDHLGYHLSELREPFSDLLDSVYSDDRSSSDHSSST